MLNHGLNHGLFLSLVKFFLTKIHSKFNKFRVKKLDLRFLLEIQAILPETSPFLSAQMAVLSSFFQMFIVLGMYNFEMRVDFLFFVCTYLTEYMWLPN
jgi:hypothetical protein